MEKTHTVKTRAASRPSTFDQGFRKGSLPSIHAAYSGLGSVQTSVFQAMSLSSSLGFPSQMGHVIPSACSGSTTVECLTLGAVLLGKLKGVNVQKVWAWRNQTCLLPRGSITCKHNWIQTYCIFFQLQPWALSLCISLYVCSPAFVNRDISA